MSFVQSIRAAGKTAAKPVVSAAKEVKTEYQTTRNSVQTKDLEEGIKETALRLIELVGEANKRENKPFTDLNEVIVTAQAQHADNVRKETERKAKEEADRIAALQRVADEAVRMAAEARVKAAEASSSAPSSNPVPGSTTPAGIVIPA